MGLQHPEETWSIDQGEKLNTLAKILSLFGDVIKSTFETK